MADATRKLANGKDFIDFQTDPSRYRHWKLSSTAPVATLAMDVDENAGLFEGYRAEAQFLRPRRRHRTRRRACSACASNIRRSRSSSCAPARTACSAPAPTFACSAGSDASAQGEFLQVHQRDAQCRSRTPASTPASTSSAAVNGTAAGGGYELALATDHIMMIDDGSHRRLAAGNAAARRAARHRRPDAGDRQAHGAPRPRRRVLHDRGRRARQARACNGAWSTNSCRPRAGKSASRRRRAEIAAQSDAHRLGARASR